MRDALNDALKTAMRSGEKRRVQTIRSINAALKNQEIEARGSGKSLGEADELALLQKLVKSRQESLDIYRTAGRDDLADVEAEEIAIVQEFLPQPMDPAAVAAAIDAAVAETGAASMKDMGKVVASLRAQYAGRMDFGQASAAIKAKLGGSAR